LKNIILSSILLLISIFGFTQNEEFDPYFSLGIKQGLNYSSLETSPGIKTSPHFGYQGGLVFRYHNEKYFALQLELNFMQKGWTENLDTIDNSYSRSLNYIELPLITQVVLGKRENLKYYVNLGTSFAYLISEKEDLTINEELYRREYYEKEVEKYFDYSALGELGLYIGTGIGDFQVGVRYQLTFTDLFDVKDENVLRESQNTLWNFSITYFFLNNK